MIKMGEKVTVRIRIDKDTWAQFKAIAAILKKPVQDHVGELLENIHQRMKDRTGRELDGSLSS
jgi:hypothetical protein